MSIWDKLTHELIDIIEWLDDTRDTLVWRFPRWQNEIKNGAKLVVREGQVAIFVNEGQLADVFQPGTYTLTTENMPILSTLRGWKYGFNSPFKAEVYFVSTRVFTDNKWGTPNPIMLRDPEFGPVRLRAFGTYALRVKLPQALLKQLVGTNRRFTLEDIQGQLRELIVSRFADALGECKVAALDLASKYDEIGQTITQKISENFTTYGLEVVQFFIENVSFPPEVEAALDKRSSMGVIGNMQSYRDYQVANAIPEAAKNPGGLAGAGIGLGAGVAMGGQFAQSLSTPQGPPPLPGDVAFHVAVNGQRTGPYQVPALSEQVASGQLTPASLVWKPGMVNWTAAGQVDELKQIFANVPPPVPK
jgi:membrane protease subunit (stomatin/prohibitin family)